MGKGRSRRSGVADVASVARPSRAAPAEQHGRRQCGERYHPPGIPLRRRPPHPITTTSLTAPPSRASRWAEGPRRRALGEEEPQGGGLTGERRAPTEGIGEGGPGGEAQGVGRGGPVEEQGEDGEKVVEPTGLEPVTPCLQSRCAANCAMAPVMRRCEVVAAAIGASSDRLSRDRPHRPDRLRPSGQRPDRPGGSGISVHGARSRRPPSRRSHAT